MANMDDLVEYQRALLDAGCTVAAVTSFHEARQLLETSLPAVLIAGLRLGEFNGMHLALVARLRSGEVPTLIVGDPDALAAAESAAIGAQYLERPSPPELAGFIRRIAWGPAQNRQSRRFPVTREVPLTLGVATGKLVNLSYGGFRARVLGPPIEISPSELDVRIVDQDLLVRVKALSSLPVRGGQEYRLLVKLRAGTETETWRRFVDQFRNAALV